MLLPTPQNSANDPAGTLKLHYEYDFSTGTVPIIDFTGSLVFPDLTKLTIGICDQDQPTDLTNPSLASQPKSFSATFTSHNDGKSPETHGQNVTFVTDVGVPGLLNLKNLQFSADHLGLPDVKFGTFELCTGILEVILKDLFEKLNLNGGDSPFSLFISANGFGINLHFGLPDIPLGGGTLENVRFELRSAIHFDFSGVGSGRGVFLVFNLGKFIDVGLDKIDWPNLSASEIGHAMLSLTAPISFTFTPFTVKFTSIFGFLAKWDPDTAKITFPGFMCVSMEGGLALAFDIGVAKGGVSLTLGLRWCPTLEAGQIKCLTDLAIGIIIDAHASVIELIDIRIHVELFATLHLECPPSQMIGNLIFSGYASISIAFVTIDVSFTVNLDNILGLHPCSAASNCAALPINAGSQQVEWAEVHADDCVADFLAALERVA